MKPLISVVIANYNYARYLAETIESALAQTYSPVEIIFIDDGSNDDSVELAMRYPVIVLRQGNQGVSAARNNATQFATGEYLLFLDADDLLLPDALAGLHRALDEAGPNMAFAYGQLQYFGEKNSIFASRAFDPDYLSRENYIPACSLIRSEVFKQVGGFDRGFDTREDWELFVRLWHAGWRGVHLPRPVLKYRKHRAKQEIRMLGRFRKRLSEAKLIALYPRFFWKKLLAHPLRFLYYRQRWNIPGQIRLHGPSGTPERVSASSITEQ